MSARPPLRRVGHKGADHIAPGNTAESFDAALAAGVDMIEFDVLPERADCTGRLILAHDYEDASERDVLTLQDGLAHLCGDPFADVELDVDLKMPCRELEVLDTLRRYGALERTLISSHYTHSLVAVRRAEPGVRLGWSVPRASRDYTKSRVYALPALTALEAFKRVFPAAAARALRERRCDAIMAHWRLVTRSLVRAVAAADGELYVWTVDDAARIRRLEEMGVTGIITNDPRLFTRESGVGSRESASP